MPNHLLTLLLGVTISFSSYSQADSVYILGLQECVDIALKNNTTVKRSLLQSENAKINYNQARASQLPSLNVGGSYGYNWGRSIDPTTNQFVAQEINFTGMNGSASMVVFNWFSLVNTVKQNSILLQSSQYDAEKARNDISLNIATFYLNVIFNKELVETAEYQLENSQKQLDRTKKLVQSGSLPRTNELELISQVASNEVNLITAQNNLNLALLNLKQGMMMPSTQKIDIIIPEMEIGTGSESLAPVEEVYNDALNNMPEIKSAELQVKGAEYGIEVARSGFTPTLSLNAGFSTNYSDAFGDRFIEDPNGGGSYVTNPGLQTASGESIQVFQPAGDYEEYGFGDQFRDNLSKQASLNLSIPIFNNLRNSSAVQRQKIALQQAEINVVEQQNFLRQTVESAHNDAVAASKAYSARQKQLEALEETYRSIENQYNLGAANFTEYQVASNNLFGAKSDLVRAKYDFIFKTKILDFYQGKDLSF
ncbi:MAG: TolC family protein [Cyclobacteriaceae bacterium]